MYYGLPTQESETSSTQLRIITLSHIVHIQTSPIVASIKIAITSSPRNASPKQTPKPAEPAELPKQQDQPPGITRKPAQPNISRTFLVSRKTRTSIASKTLQIVARGRPTGNKGKVVVVVQVHLSVFHARARSCTLVSGRERPSSSPLFPLRAGHSLPGTSSHLSCHATSTTHASLQSAY
jgi:hypothetical protein